MVLLHGMDSDLFTWRCMEGPLGAHFALLMVDLRGHGRTAYEGTDLSPAAMAADLLVLLDRLAVPRAHLVGHSLGAFPALQFARAHPHRVLSVVVEDMGLTRAPRTADEEAAVVQRAEEVRAQIPPAAEYASRAEARAALEAAGVRDTRAAALLETQCREHAGGTVSVYFRAYASGLFGFYAARLVACERGALVEAIKEAGLRLLFVLAEEAQSVVGSSFEARALREAFGGLARVERVAGAAHNVHKTQPERFVELVLAFIQALPH